MEHGDIQDHVITYLADIRYHRVFYLPPNPSKNRYKRLRVSYSDIGRSACENEEDEAQKPTIWFCGGLMAGRYFPALADPVLKARGVRLITIDRPGIGGTDKVPLSERMSVYLEIVPALLAHLKVRYVTLACNSCGVIYATNILLHHRRILHPLHPTLSVFAPWVHQSHTRNPAIAMTELIPRAGIAKFHTVVTFASTHITPILNFSGGLVAKAFPSEEESPLGSCLLHSIKAGEGENRVPLTRDERRLQDHIVPQLIKYLMAEELSGVSDEVLLLLKRTPEREPWGSWGDFDKVVPILAEQEAVRLQTNGARNLKVEIFYAASDHMIGKKGSRWLDACWTDKARAGVIDFESCTWPDTTHDGILERRFGLLDKWVLDIAGKYQEAAVSLFGSEDGEEEESGDTW